MALNTLLHEAASLPARDAAKLLATAPQEGFADAFFQRVAGLAGSDPTACARLAKHWRFLLPIDAGLAYRSKAAGERSQGRWLQSAQSFSLAGAHALTKVDKWSFQVGAVDSLARAGMTDEAVALGKKLRRELKRLERPGLAARVGLNVGNALVWADRYAEAAAWYREAAPHLSGYEAAAALLGLSTSELFSTQAEEAAVHALQAREMFHELGLPHFEALCDTNLAQVALLQGRADEALQILLLLKPALESNSAEAARVSEFIGDAYYRLNLFPEAIDSYSVALSGGGLKSMPLNRANVLFGIAAAHLGSGDPRKALSGFRSAEKSYESIGNEVWTHAARVERAGAMLSSGRYRRAADLAKAASARLQQLGARHHQCLALLKSAEAHLRLGLDCSQDLTKARKLVAKHGYVPLQWKVHSLAADSSTGSARKRHQKRMYEAMLQGRMLLTSTAAKMSFLHDKSEALRSYLGELLAKPTQRNIAQVLEVVRNARAAALVDELLASPSLPGQASKDLGRLRQELNLLNQVEATGGPARRMPASSPDLSRLQRRWIEATWELQRTMATAPRQGQEQVSVFVQTQDSLFALANGRAKRLEITPRGVHELTKWLQFELMGPLADKDASSDEALDLLCDLQRAIPTQGALCPEGDLWRVPFQAFENETEPVLLLSPAFDGQAGNARLPKNPKAMLWYHEAADLPQVKNEAHAFLERFPQAIVCRTAAEVRACLNASEVDVLHVATHARVNYRNPMFSFLEFEDGAVYATEIAKSALQAGLVTLSACETGSLTYTFQEEPDGLVRSFLARGAKAVVASAWPLDDEAALVTMKPFYDGLISGATLAESLRTARKKCREWRKHPYFWGPLAIYGGYSFG